MNIKDIAKSEILLFNKITAYHGTMSEIENNMRIDNIFEKYESIFKQYIVLADKYNNIEALKRAIFIQWYSYSEPSSFTGIFLLSEDDERLALQLLERAIIKKEMDAELISMLYHYKEVNDIVFFKFEDLFVLNEFLQNILPENPLEKLRNNSFSARGQMGEYWKSIINEIAV